MGPFFCFLAVRPGRSKRREDLSFPRTEGQRIHRRRRGAPRRRRIDVGSCTVRRHIHMYVRYICTPPLPKSSWLPRKFRSLDESGDGGNCRKITNVDDSPAAIRERGHRSTRHQLAAGKSGSPAMTDDGRRILKFETFYLPRSTGRRIAREGETADRNVELESVAAQTSLRTIETRN